MTSTFENKVKILKELMSDTSPMFENARYMLDVPPQTQSDYELQWALFIDDGQLVDSGFTSLSEIAEIWPMRLGPNHPKVVEAEAAFEAWWASYEPLVFLDVGPLSALPNEVDPQAVWTVIVGLTGVNMTAGFLSFDGNNWEVVGYVFCARPFAPSEAGTSVFTELRQYCSQDEDDAPDGPCRGCVEELNFCNGRREQFCEISNYRVPGGKFVSTLDEALALLGVNDQDSDKRSCSSCDEVLPPGAKFCSSCGEEVPSGPAFCSQCGTLRENRARFCHQCGNGFDD